MKLLTRFITISSFTGSIELVTRFIANGCSCGPWLICELLLFDGMLSVSSVIATPEPPFMTSNVVGSIALTKVEVYWSKTPP
jgi:hypothetical protein